MRIEIYKDWIIRSDERQIILCKSAGMYTDKKTGKESEQFKNESYRSTIQHALKTLCQKEIYASESTTLQGIKQCCKRLEKMLDEFGKQLGEKDVIGEEENEL